MSLRLFRFNLLKLMPLSPLISKILPFFDNLLDPLRSWFNHDYHVMHDNWPNTALNKINPLIPN